MHDETPKPYAQTGIHDLVLYVDQVCHMMTALTDVLAPLIERAAIALELQHEDMHKPRIPHS